MGPQGEPAPLVLAAGGGLSGSGTAASPLEVTSGGITVDHLAGPARLYSRLMTPRWLQANADFHSARVFDITDTEVSFGPADTGNEQTRLLTVPLLPPNTFKPDETYLVRIVVNQVVASSDNDPGFGVTDGTRFIGIQKGDEVNADGAAWVLLGMYGDNLASRAIIPLGGPGQNAQNFEILIRLGPVAGSNTPVFFISRIGLLAGRHQESLPIDRSKAISFVVFANNAAELYTFQSFEVTIDREG
ncbi:MAG TPA: hypothetical protein VFZ09_17225 [Archangium sp.]|uniref:hypothetical protein n=1 Tax=Archangium sp. TaxID=1872627 RepID=UPI002E3231A6|nr:hypothetical protein [Archangium sp.]HEX5747987.1 hypothetical protein [Archangium sp.]